MSDNRIIIIFVILSGGVFIITVLGAFIAFLVEFFRELRYLNQEIRCNHGVARDYWIRQRRRLWLSLLPFVKY